MKTAFALIAGCALVVFLAATTLAQPPEAPAPGPPPARPISEAGIRPLSIGPADSIGAPRRVRGKLAVIANPPRGMEVAAVDLQADGKLIGISQQRPYMVNFDSATIPDGEHVFKAVGKDAEGKQIWAAARAVLVSNSDQDGNAPGAAAPPIPGPGDMPPDPGAPVPEPASTGKRSDRVYSSDKYGFTVRYPASWDFKDDTAHIKPKVAGGVWLVFGAPPIDKSSIVVNVRRRQIEPTTDADIFAKYNTYVLNWERKTVLGSPAFVTTTGSNESKRVIHRTIIIRDHNAWMLNCIDTTGEPAEISKALFESMVNTLTPKTAPSEARPAGSSSPGKG